MSEATIPAGRARSETLGWAAFAVGALGVAGVFAILLALSRAPFIASALPWPDDFFYRGLVVHVVVSLEVWLLGVLAFVVALGTYDMAEGPVKLAWLGRLGQVLALVSFPCLFIPAFLPGAEPELFNYIPVIRHPLYDIGLLLLAVGILAPVVRHLVNLPGRKNKLSPLGFAASAISIAYVAALWNFLAAGIMISRVSDIVTAREEFNWGGGHILSFAYAAVMFTCWALLARRSVGEAAIEPEAFKVGVGIVAAFTLPTLPFYFAFDVFGDKLQGAFRTLQFGIVAPALIVAVPVFAAVVRSGGWRRGPWRDPAFTALAVSLLLFAVGGVMGLAIDASDTRTPAHYHAVITAISVSGMGLILTYGLEALGRPAVNPRAANALLWLYGGGQLVASLGMFVAGGYGALRKTPTDAAPLVNVAKLGMGVHGIGALVAIAGGAAFIVVAFRALTRHANPGDASR